MDSYKKGSRPIPARDFLQGIKIYSQNQVADFVRPIRRLYKLMDSQGGIKLVIFDLDRTLGDPLYANMMACQEMLLRAGEKATLAKISKVCCTARIGDMVRELIPATKKDIAQFDRVCGYLGELFIKYAPLNLRTPLVDVMDILLYRRIKMGVATNRDVSAWPAIRALRIESYLDAVATAAMAKPKPFPDMLQLILDMVKVQPEDAVYMGDSEDDLKAAKAAGIPVIMVEWKDKKKK